MGFPKLPMQWGENGYEIVEKLGEGSYGAVYKLVKNKGTDQEEVSALKIVNWTLGKRDVRYEFGNDWEEARRCYTQRFNRMANEIGILETFTGMRNIVQIKGSCMEKMPELNYWKFYIQMEYLKDLIDYTVECQGLSRAKIISLGIDICTALEACHAKGIIHRDIKPANIMVTKGGHFKLGDFGVARQQIAGTMTVTGSYDFMAPEVLKTANYDETVDIYSLGLVLYYLANNFKLPFAEIEDPQERMNYRMNGEEEWQWSQKLSTWGTGPKSSEELLYDIVKKACANDPKKRYQSAKEMKKDLKLCELKLVFKKDFWEKNNDR